MTLGSMVTELVAGLQFPEGPVLCADGSLLVSEMAAGRLTRVAPDGTTELFAETGGGPNGLARLGDGRFVVCQNGGSRFGVGRWPYEFGEGVQLFRPMGAAEHPVPPAVQLVSAAGHVSTLATTFLDAAGRSLPLVRPSDVCADGLSGFYLTDGGTVQGRSRTITGLLHGTVDGGLQEVVYPLEMPNGVALSPDGGTLYVAETRTRRIWAFEVVAPGVIGRARSLATVPSGGPMNVGGADGLCVGPAGHVVVATLGTGGVTVFTPDGDLWGAIPADDPMTTNVTVSADGSRLYVTLASTGRIIVIDDWLAMARRHG